MTTRAAAALYEAQHQMDMQGRKVAIYNPYNKPLNELSRIYGFNNGGREGSLEALLLAEDGVLLGGHCCSSESYMPHDLGILDGTRPDRHESFKKHYPDGYVMEFVREQDIESHSALLKAFEIALERQ